LIRKDDIACLRGVENGRQSNPPSGLIVDALVLSGGKIKRGAQRITDPVDRLRAQFFGKQIIAKAAQFSCG